MKESESVLMKQMNRKPVIQNKVSQKRKANIVYQNIYMESRKMVSVNLFNREQ